MKIRSILALGAAVLAATFAIVASAQTPSPDDRAPFWPALGNKPPVVNEWYSDVPWHQKLGTFAGNQIDEPLIMPYAALPQGNKDYCTKKNLSDAACMIETGVTNILGMQRIDTEYATPVKTPATAPKETPPINNPAECQDSMPCIEVMLKVGNYYATADDSGVKLAPRVYGYFEAQGDFYRGYTISDGNAYAPQLPWFMSHYCDAAFEKNYDGNQNYLYVDMQDPVCYADYLSPFNNGFNAFGPGGRFGWPRAVPWSAWPQYDNNHCLEGITVCNIVLATFDLAQVPKDFDSSDLVFPKYNDFLLQWFNYALKNFKTDQGTAENQRHFPWSGNPMTWDDFYPQSAQNPFLGTFATTGELAPAQNFSTCDTTVTGPNGSNCTTTKIYRAKQTLYPRECTLDDLAKGDATRLRKCGLNYELHHNGWIQQWPSTWDVQSLRSADIVPANQYGRTSFLFAGVPGLQLPVSFYRGSANKGYSIYEQVYNTSIFSLYIPIANEADTKRAFVPRQYTGRQFYHTLLMTNHMEADPAVFAEGIRGRALWHNEYRMEGMYREATKDGATEAAKKSFPPMMFNAAFDGTTAKVPFHGETCDGCHVRNGSGIPINTQGKLDAQLQEFMTGAVYDAKKSAAGTVFTGADYTFTGNIHPMKLVFFDLGRSTARDDGSVFSEPKAFTPLTLLSPPRTATDLYYSNAIMNFHGDSFHVTQGNSYQWSYVPASDDSLVVATQRKNAELDKIYTPWQVKVGSFYVAGCQIVLPGPTGKPWPATCSDVDGAAIENAINTQLVGYMLLNGKRLGNSSAIEAMPDDAIVGFRDSQQTLLGKDIAGELIWTVGSRDGVGGKVKQNCITNSTKDCYIGRFGWLGDRASLDDQVANAAFVEMNMTSSEGYKKLYPNGKSASPIRYLAPNCGPADKACVTQTYNRDLSEKDIERMADYARWIGNPTRSEFQVQLTEVSDGEGVFRRLKCDTCHVIDRIDINPDNTMLSQAYRDRLKKRYDPKTSGNKPFLSYLGTDLLMHDMGYLSQVGIVPAGVKIRDPATGVVLTKYQNFVQKIRTPALKGMRFNRFVTDSQANTKNPGVDPACDFLMHDGRACDAVEAAFMHDGPAIKKLGVIDALNGLSANDVLNLRAFLYSL
ncbi:di-heme oxidoredictase family protein [Rudaea sp.]|uniref:di-heme oxidoredictase family protein n=1 Tax=Rudaea sp. TaxID=2136325 RepID=UPI002ED07CD0